MLIIFSRSTASAFLSSREGAASGDEAGGGSCNIDKERGKNGYGLENHMEKVFKHVDLQHQRNGNVQASEMMKEPMLRYKRSNCDDHHGVQAFRHHG